MMDEQTRDNVNNSDDHKKSRETVMDWTPSIEKSLPNGASIKREMPDYPASNLEQQQQQQMSYPRMQIKEEIREDFNQPSSSGYHQKNNSQHDWFNPSRGPENLPSNVQNPAPSSLDTLQRMMQRFDGVDVKPHSHPHDPRPPALDHFNSPDRPQNLPWMDRNLSPYSYPYFSVGLTPQSSSSTDSPNLNNPYSNKEYPCKKCTYKANSKKELDEHLKEEHYKVSCPHCNYIATSQGRMTRHMEYAHGPKETSPQKPQNGEASPNSSEGSADHIAMLGSKTLKKPKKCKTCKNVFITKNDYYDHMSEHYPSLLKCEVRHCKFATTLPHHMRYHMAIHNGDKSFKCPECNYKCATTSMLKSHMKCHDTVCRYRCATCSFAAKHANALNSHLKRTGHVAGPVLGTDGSIPLDDPSSRFENHVRKKPQKSSTSTSSEPLPSSSSIHLSMNLSDEKAEPLVHYPVPKLEPISHSLESSPLKPFIPAPSNLLHPSLPPPPSHSLPPPHHLSSPHHHLPPPFTPHQFSMAHMYMQNLRYMNSLVPQSFNFGLSFPWSSSPGNVPYLGGENNFLHRQSLMQHTNSSSPGQISSPDARSESHPSVKNDSHSDNQNSVSVKVEKSEDDCQPLDLSMKPPVLEKKVDVLMDRKEPINRKSRRKGIAQKLDLTALRSGHDVDVESEAVDENCDSHNIPESSRLFCDKTSSRSETPEKRAKLSPSFHSKLPELEPIISQENPMFAEEKIFPCHHCQVVFKDKRMFSSHASLHSLGNPFLCSDCKRSFQTGREFFLHLSEYEHKLLPIQ